VKVVSVTNGAAGHHQQSAEELTAVRRREAAEAVRLLPGAEYTIWEFPDGQLQATLAVRERIIQEVRTFQPDLVLTHRPCDYHPDHRAVGMAVQDATYLITVPLIMPRVPALRRDPAIAYMVDFFKRPYPFQADVTLDVAAEFENVVDLLDCHVSQVYEWLPYSMGLLDQVPADRDARKQRLRDWFAQRSRQIADHFRASLVRDFGEVRGAAVEFAEVYEMSEYARQLDPAACRELFLMDTE
jgi:LmbE family N-acetylglucosaminyl deacetylase